MSTYLSSGLRVGEEKGRERAREREREKERERDVPLAQARSLHVLEKNSCAGHARFDFRPKGSWQEVAKAN